MLLLSARFSHDVLYFTGRLYRSWGIPHRIRHKIGTCRIFLSNADCMRSRIWSSSHRVNGRFSISFYPPQKLNISIIIRRKEMMRHVPRTLLYLVQFDEISVPMDVLPTIILEHFSGISGRRELNFEFADVKPFKWVFFDLCHNRKREKKVLHLLICNYFLPN